MINKFSERLKVLREYKNINQTTLGKHLGFGATAISSYENGRNEPSMDTLIRIAKYFDVSVDYLLGVEDSPKWMERLSKSDKELLKDYHKLPKQEKELASAMIKALYKGGLMGMIV